MSGNYVVVSLTRMRSERENSELDERNQAVMVERRERIGKEEGEGGEKEGY